MAGKKKLKLAKPTLAAVSQQLEEETQEQPSELLNESSNNSDLQVSESSESVSDAATEDVDVDVHETPADPEMEYILIAIPDTVGAHHVWFHETQQDLVDHLKQIVADSSLVRSTRFEIVYGRRLSFTSLPHAYLLDGDEQISLIDAPAVKESVSGSFDPDENAIVHLRRYVADDSSGEVDDEESQEDGDDREETDNVDAAGIELQSTHDDEDDDDDDFADDDEDAAIEGEIAN